MVHIAITDSLGERRARMYEAGVIKLDELITEKYTLDDINQGMKDLRAGKNLRGMIAFE
jgi:Zn-dependent alcohol dehydrogenase